MKASVCVVLAVFLACCAASFAPQANPLQIDVASDGSYKVLLDGQVWLNSAPTSLWMYNAWQKLTLASASDTTGRDTIDAYKQHTITWSMMWGIEWQTSFKVYQNVPAIVFEQVYVQGANATRMASVNSVSSAFPAFVMEGQCTEKGYLQYSGTMFPEHIGNWCARTADVVSGLESGPIAIFDKQLNTMLLSPFSNFMQAALEVVNGTVRWGMEGGTEVLFPNTRMSTVLWVGRGINEAFETWGSAMLRYYGKESSISRDYSLQTLGYWTDNGAYYYYNTEPGKNYEETLLDVYAYAQANKIPYRYLQLDSWWYPKGPNNGVTTWDAMPSVFPNGLLNLYEKTQWPMFAHNRYWSNQTTYATDNGGKFYFELDSNGWAWPEEGQFWQWLLQDAKRWGLIVYEQDWLNNEYENVWGLTGMSGLARQWLLNMGSAAADNDLTIQYCMALPRHLLQSVEIPAVSQIRASGDYQPGNEQWKIGVTSIIAYALGLAPSKDDFWTTTTQPGSPTYHGFNHEPYPALEACVATYSLGPVGPSDGVGFSNASLIMKSARADGILLQPSRPFRAIDPYFLQQTFGSGGPSGQLWTTASFVSDLLWDHIFAADLTSSYSVTAALLRRSGERRLAYDAKATLKTFDDQNALVVPVCGRSDFQLWHTAPIFSNGIALLGELEKWVPVAANRIKGVSFDETQVYVQLSGAPEEEVIIWFAQQNGSTWTAQNVSCYIGSSGASTLTFPAGDCTYI